MANFWENVKNRLNRTLTGTTDNAGKISKYVEKGKSFTVNNPTSFRTFHNVGKNTLDEKDIDVGLTSGKAAEMPSTAIESARYDPDDNSLNVTYRGGNKEYKYAATPEDVKKFVNAPSKGTLIASWNKTGEDPHTYPGF